MLTRRELLRKTAQLGAVIALPSQTSKGQADDSQGVVVNDAQSQLNPTRVHRLDRPESSNAIRPPPPDAPPAGSAAAVACAPARDGLRFRFL